MKYITTIFLLMFCAALYSQNNIVFGAGISYTNGIPTFTPPSKTARVAIDTVTMNWYEYATPGGWRLSGLRVQSIAGCSAPSYVPGKGDSKLVLNSCTILQNGQGPELYYYDGSAWIFINEKSTAPTYTAGTGIDITGTTISNTAPDQVVTISGASGTYPNFTIPTPAVTLGDLTDVTLTSPANNQILQYNSAGSQWVNATLSAITGTGSANKLAIWSGTSGITFNTFAGLVTQTANGITQQLGSYSFFGQIDQYSVPYFGQGAYAKDGSGAVTPVSTGLSSAIVSILEPQAQGFSFFAAPYGTATTTNIFTNNYLRFRVTKTGQVAAGVATPDAAAKIDITSTTQGLLFPRMTTTQRDAILSPPDGLVIYNTTAVKLQVRASGAWIDLH